MRIIIDKVSKSKASVEKKDSLNKKVLSNKPSKDNIILSMLIIFPLMMMVLLVCFKIVKNIEEDVEALKTLLFILYFFIFNIFIIGIAKDKEAIIKVVIEKIMESFKTIYKNL